MRVRPWTLPLVALLVAAVSCDIPGASPPTAFVFPTPNETLTAIFAPTATPPAALETPTPPPGPTTAPTVVTPAGGPATATPSSLSTRPNGVVAEAPRLGTSPTIDGDLSDWPALPYKADQIVYGASQWTGLSDCSASFGLAWDASYLYLAAQVTDDKYVQVASGGNIWKGDEVEIQLDADLPIDFYTTTISTDDYQMGMTIGNFGGIKPQAYRWYPRAKETALTNVTVAGKATPQGYDLEARIPWTVFSITPAEGNRFGFAFSVSDNDLTGTAAQQSMVSSVSTRKLLNPTTWGTLALAPAVVK